MRYLVLVTDYDGTIATNGKADETALSALEYGTLPDVLSLGSPRNAVAVNEALAVLEDPKVNLNLNLLGISLADRPQYFGHLFPRLQAMRIRTGRPHWMVSTRRITCCRSIGDTSVRPSACERRYW